MILSVWYGWIYPTFYSLVGCNCRLGQWWWFWASGLAVYPVYLVYPVYPVYKVYPVYPVYAVYLVYPVYKVYPVYPPVHSLVGCNCRLGQWPAGAILSAKRWDGRHIIIIVIIIIIVLIIVIVIVIIFVIIVIILKSAKKWEERNIVKILGSKSNGQIYIL